MAWLEEQIKTKGRQIGEWEAGEKLTEFRSHEQYFAYVAMRGLRSIRADENMVADWLMITSALQGRMEVCVL